MTGKFLIATGLVLAGSLVSGSMTDAGAATLAVPAQYGSLAEAFEAAVSGDRVELDAGVYYESRLSLPNGVALVGVADDKADVVIDGQANGRILLIEGVDKSSLVANITFRNGHAAGQASYDRSGGAIFCSNSTVRITNCVFEDNRSDGHGGAIRCNNSTPLITGCVFVGNSAAGGGGAVDCSFGSSPLVRGCDFRENEAAWGGALSCRGYSSPQVLASTFSANAATGSKGYGGAVFADYGSQPAFTHTTLWDNSARYGGAFACLSDAETNLTNCTVADNSAQVLGGGLFIYDASPFVTSSIIAFQTGTGISAEGGAAPQISCSDIYGNSSGDWVGSIAAQLATNENLSADPQFCGSGDGATTYSLGDGSPCGSEDLSCGNMGAWPVGCDTVLPTVTTFDAAWQDQRALLDWQALLYGAAVNFRLTGSRINEPSTEWEVPFQDLGGGYFEAIDPASNGEDGDTYLYRLYLDTGDGTWDLVDQAQLTATPQFPGIRDLNSWPNPFNPMTTISFRLGQPQRARVSVYAQDGRRVAVLAERDYDAGLQSETWDGRDATGGRVASGLYIVLVEGKSTKLTRKITLLK